MVMAVFASDPSQRTSIPVSVQSSGRVSYPQGFGEDYEKDLTKEVSAKNIERKVINQLFYEITSLLKEIQLQGSPSWIKGLEYPKGAIVYYNGESYLSLVGSNKTTPVRGANWKNLSYEPDIPIPEINSLPGGLPPLRLVNEQYLQWDGFQNGGNGTILTTLESYHKSRTKKSKCRTLQMFVKDKWVTVPYA